jgi:hypothetical protein
MTYEWALNRHIDRLLERTIATPKYLEGGANTEHEITGAIEQGLNFLESSLPVESDPVYKSKKEKLIQHYSSEEAQAKGPQAVYNRRIAYLADWLALITDFRQRKGDIFKKRVHNVEMGEDDG